MDILITGGAGFVGSQLAWKLSALGNRVWVLDNLSYGYLDNLVYEGNSFKNFLCRDVRDPKLINCFRNKGIEVIIHLAGVSSLPECESKPSQAYDINVTATANVLELARSLEVRRFIFASTSAVYENCKAKRFKESDLVDPDLVYSSTKLAAERICQSYAKNYNLDVLICRFFNVYGPHQDIHRPHPPFTSYLAKQLVTGNQPVIFNNTEYKRDYIFVEDLVQLITLMLSCQNKYSAEVFNVGSGVGYSSKQIYNALAEVSGKVLEPKFEDPIGYWDKYPEIFQGTYGLKRNRVIKEVHKHSIADLEKTSSTFNWSPKTSLISGLKSVYEYALKSCIKV